jgi:hypothetical protein
LQAVRVDEARVNGEGKAKVASTISGLWGIVNVSSGSKCVEVTAEWLKIGKAENICIAVVEVDNGEGGLCVGGGDDVFEGRREESNFIFPCATCCCDLVAEGGEDAVLYLFGFGGGAMVKKLPLMEFHSCCFTTKQ